jgi:hypothetical protein
MAASFNGSLQFSVQDWMAWSPERACRSSWLSWAGAREDNGGPHGGESYLSAGPARLPLPLKRRATAIGQMALAVALAIGDLAKARIVIASRHGEYDQTVAILSALAAHEPVSPAAFSMSVHHGLAGLLSIHGGNRQGHIAVAAGPDTFCSGLMEASLCLAEAPELPVLLLYYDTPLPPAYGPVHDEIEDGLPMAAAFLLRPRLDAGISMQYRENPDRRPATGSQVLTFLRLLLSAAPAAESRGERMIWEWSRVH